MKRLLLAVVGVWAAAAPAWGEAGRTAASTLRRPIGARPLAMADAFSAVDGDLDSISYNPAGLGNLKRPELKTVYTHGIAEDHFSYLGYAQPFKSLVLAAGAMYYDAGTISLNLSNGVQETRKVQQDYVGLLGAAAPLFPGFTVGAVGKFYRLELAQEARASGFAVDGGALWHSPLPGLSLGAAIQNVGPDVKFEQEGDPLPLTMRAGAAYTLKIQGEGLRDAAISFDRILFTAEAIQLREEKIAAATGVEMRMPFSGGSFGALRLGYIFNRDLDSVTFGIGLREGRFLLDYALGIKKAVNNAHHFAVGFLF